MNRRFMFLLAGLAETLFGQARLVKDIDPRFGLLDGVATNFVQVGTTVFYASGNLLWRTDGTAGGTVILREIALNFFGGTSLSCLQPFGGKLLFVADEDSTGNQLWESDGTTAGTKLIAQTGGGTSISGCPVN